MTVFEADRAAANYPAVKREGKALAAGAWPWLASVIVEQRPGGGVQVKLATTFGLLLLAARSSTGEWRMAEVSPCCGVDYAWGRQGWSCAHCHKPGPESPLDVSFRRAAPGASLGGALQARLELTELASDEQALVALELESFFNSLGSQ